MITPKIEPNLDLFYYLLIEGSLYNTKDNYELWRSYAYEVNNVYHSEPANRSYDLLAGSAISRN